MASVTMCSRVAAAGTRSADVSGLSGSFRGISLAARPAVSASFRPAAAAGRRTARLEVQVRLAATVTVHGCGICQYLRCVICGRAGLPCLTRAESEPLHWAPAQSAGWAQRQPRVTVRFRTVMGLQICAQLPQARISQA